MKLVLDHFRELYKYRVLIESLVWRDVRARYRGSALGFLWTLLNPLMLLLVYHVLMTKLTDAVHTKNLAVFLFVGILPWQWLATSITNGTTAISGGGSLITRVCMPPQVLPAVSVLANLVNFLCALPVAFLAAAYYQIWPSPALLALPLVIAIELAFVYGVTLLVATVNVRFRDVQFITSTLLTFWFFLTPIVYPLQDVADGRWKKLLLANPATGLIAPYQQVIHARTFPDPLFLGLGLLWALVVLFAAVHLFESMRDVLAEEI